MEWRRRGGGNVVKRRRAQMEVASPHDGSGMRRQTKSMNWIANKSERVAILECVKHLFGIMTEQTTHEECPIVLKLSPCQTVEGSVILPAWANVHIQLLCTVG